MGGVRVGEERIYTLTYADDMMEEEDELRSMIEKLERGT